MKRVQNRVFVALLILGAALTACSGNSASTIAPSSNGSGSTVSFLVVVPSASNTQAHLRHPDLVVPPNATSVSFTLDSVGGTASVSTPTTETLSASNSACTSVNGQLSCVFNISAPVGALVYTVTVYNGTSVIAEGNVSVTTTGGGTVTAPVTLSGTVAKIVVSVGAAVTGVAVTLPITVQAEDSNGNTILGTYTSPVTVSDNDSSGQTSIATSGSDNPPAGQLLSSSDTATLTYAGGAMSSAARISATASGVSQITAANFLPASNYLAQSNTITFAFTSYSTQNYDAVATPLPAPVWSTHTSPPIPIATGQAFNGVSTAIAVSGIGYTDAVTSESDLSQASTEYYAWSASNGAATLGPLGYTDPDNGFYPDFLFESPLQSLQQTCATPYAQLLIIPMPASWNVMSGSGTCTTVYNDGEGDADTFAYAANGSYTDTSSFPSGFNFPPGSAMTTVDSAGNASYTLSSFVTPCCGEGSLVVPAPSPGASMIPVTFTIPGGVEAFVPTPAPSMVPNPWAAIGLPNGTIPSPLLQDTMTFKGAISSIPTMCALPVGLVPSSNPPLSEADESVTIADPMDNLLPFYTAQTIKHYYLNGVGEVCNENQTALNFFDGIAFGFSNFWAYNEALGGALSWYAGLDTNFDSEFTDTFTFITQTSLTAAMAQTRDFTKATATATQALTAMTYHLAHGPGLAARLRATTKSHFTRSSLRWPLHGPGH